MNRSNYLPDTDRLSLIVATILLAYAVARFVNLSSYPIVFQIAGAKIGFVINAQTIVVLIVAGLTASGADWLMRKHPYMKDKRTIEHWILPALTSWVIGFPLMQIPLGPQWWASFIVGGSLLILVLVAEYITIDPDDIRQPLAAVGLTAVSFALYLILTIALYFSAVRLFTVIPAVMIASGLVCLRTIHLRSSGRWAFFESAIVALISTELATALHYWPISSTSYGLALLGPTYALTSLIISLTGNIPIRRAVVEPLILLLAALGIAYWLR